MPAQSSEFLEAAIEAEKAIKRIAKTIEELKRDQKALEDEHGITEVKNNIRDLKNEMEITAYGLINRATAASQGRLFDDVREG